MRWWPRPGRGRTPPGFGFWASDVKFRVEVLLDWGGVNFLILMVKECWGMKIWFMWGYHSLSPKAY